MVSRRYWSLSSHSALHPSGRCQRKLHLQHDQRSLSHLLRALRSFFCRGLANAVRGPLGPRPRPDNHRRELRRRHLWAPRVDPVILPAGQRWGGQRRCRLEAVPDAHALLDALRDELFRLLRTVKRPSSASVCNVYSQRSGLPPAVPDPVSHWACSTDAAQGHTRAIAPRRWQCGAEVYVRWHTRLAEALPMTGHAQACKRKPQACHHWLLLCAHMRHLTLCRTTTVPEGTIPPFLQQGHPRIRP